MRNGSYQNLGGKGQDFRNQNNNSRSMKSGLGLSGQNVIKGSKKLEDDNLYFNDEVSKRLARGYQRVKPDDSNADTSGQNMVNRVDAVYNYMMQDKMPI